jgi:hypothetical protein
MATVDTLKAYETLTGADMPERQARARVTIVQELQETRLADVAGKGDIASLKTLVNEDIAALKKDIRELELSTKSDIAALRSDMKEMEARLEARIERVKFDLLKWFIPLILGEAAFIVTLLKLLK